MATQPRNNARNTRGRPFEAGNAGRPKGSRHKATLAAEALTRKAIELALVGDLTALRLCMERILPPRRERPIAIDLSALTCPADALTAVGNVISAMAQGDITPIEATAVAALLEAYRRAFETTELENRVAALEPKT